VTPRLGTPFLFSGDDLPAAACPWEPCRSQSVGWLAMMAYVWIAIGSALGGMARHWCTMVATAWLGARFPWGTLFINILGSFVIGFFFALTGPEGRFDETPLNARLFVMTGICGGYTTFSAFSLQTLSLFQEGAWGRGGAYILASVVLCLIAVWAGYALAVAINEAGT
jgi:CrcB protein